MSERGRHTAGPFRPEPKVKARIQAARRRFKQRCAKYDGPLGDMLEQVFLHGPLEQEKAAAEAIKHPEFHDFFDACEIDGRPFLDLSGLGRYHMTGEHSAIDEQPWRPRAAISAATGASDE